MVRRNRVMNAQRRTEVAMNPMPSTAVTNIGYNGAPEQNIRSAQSAANKQATNNNAGINWQQPLAPAANAVGGNNDENAYFEPIAMYESPKNDDGSSPAAIKPNPPHVVNRGRQSLMPE